jgi:hypothetical protein
MKGRGHNMKNYALPGNSNETLNRVAAIDYLVDSCLNNEECEWASCSVRIKTKNSAMSDIAEVARSEYIDYDNEMLEKVYDTIKMNLI